MSRRSSRLVDTESVHGFDNEVNSLVKTLVQQQESDDQFKAIGIFGKRGVGKTALCQVLFSKTQVKTKFLPRIWVCMSKQHNQDEDPKAALVKRMLTSLGVDEKIIGSISEDHGIAGLLYALHLQLKGKRYLIVLDDADDRDADLDDWYEGLDSAISQREKWGERLAYGFPKGYGGTVIVTSRSEEIAKKMVGEKNYLHHLLPLSDPENCLSIFMDAAGKDIIGKEFDLSNLEELKEELRQKCVGLPFAAKMMGQTFKLKKTQVEAARTEI